MAAPLGKPQREGLDPASLKAGGLLCGPVGMMGLGELRNPRPLGAGGHPRQASGQEPLSVPLRDPGPCCPDPAVVGSRACEHGARVSMELTVATSGRTPVPPSLLQLVGFWLSVWLWAWTAPGQRSVSPRGR